MRFIKNNYMKLISCLVWLMGIPAGYLLGFKADLANSRWPDSGYIIKYEFSWEQAMGVWILFIALGFIAFLLASIYHNNRNKKQ